MGYEFDLEKKNKVEKMYNYFDERRLNLINEIKDIDKKFLYLQIGLMFFNALIIGAISAQNLSILQLVVATTVVVVVESPFIIVKAIKLDRKKDEKEQEMKTVLQEMDDLEKIRSDIKKIEKLKNEELTAEKLHNLYDTYKEVSKKVEMESFVDFLAYLYPEDFEKNSSEEPKVLRNEKLFEQRTLH